MTASTAFSRNARQTHIIYGSVQMQLRSILAVAAAFTVLACGSDSSGSTEPPQTALNGSMSAVVNGDDWNATLSVQAAYTNGILAIAGVDGGNVTIAVATAASGPGSYPIGVPSSTNASYTMGGGQALVWQAVSTLGSGSMEIETLTATSASGTFHFELPAVTTSGATGTKSITNGKFEVKF
jgi:hypothetical protein